MEEELLEGVCLDGLVMLFLMEWERSALEYVRITLRITRFSVLLQKQNLIKILNDQRHNCTHP